MKKHREQAYAKRFNRVLDFIDRHLDVPISVERLGRVAHFSTFHFHRQFTDYVGITPTRYIQLARLRRASYRLAFNPLERITDIGLEAGFERSESFSRAFKAAFGQTPSAFRKDPDWTGWSTQSQFVSPREINHMQVKIVTTEPVTVAVLEHRGDPNLLNDSVHGRRSQHGTHSAALGAIRRQVALLRPVRRLLRWKTRAYFRWWPRINDPASPKTRRRLASRNVR